MAKGSFNKIEKGPAAVRKKRRRSAAGGDDLNVLKLIVKGKEVVINMKEIMELANCEDKLEIMGAMNKASSYYFYFGRIEADLKEVLDDAEENFEIWLAAKKSRYEDEKNETARLRQVMVNHKELFKTKKEKVQRLRRYYAQASIAKKAIEKNINLIQSIGAMVREGSKNKGEVFFPDEEERKS